MASASCGGFNPVDADFVHLAGDADLVIDGEYDTGRLLAVAQGRVVDLDPWREVQVLADFWHEIVGADPPFSVFKMCFAHRLPQGMHGQSGGGNYTYFPSVPKEKTTFPDGMSAAASGSGAWMSEILALKTLPRRNPRLSVPT